MGTLRCIRAQARMHRAERDVDRDRADHADGIERGEAVEIVADSSTMIGTRRRHDRRHPRDAEAIELRHAPAGSSPSRAIRYWTEIMSVMAVFAAESSSTPPTMRTAHSPQLPT